MFSLTEIRRSFRAIWLLFRARPEGLALLDRSMSGFWRSFAVIVLVIPINAVTMLAVSRTDRSDATAVSLIVDGLPLLLADWVLFPILLALAAGPLGVSRTYVSYVVARNWAAPLAAAVMTLPLVLQGAGWIDGTGMALLSMVALGLILRLHYLIVRLGLDVAAGFAIGLVVADLLLTLLLVRILA